MDSLGGILTAVLIALIVLGFVMALPTMILWNWLMPEIFSLTTITFWQAWGLNLLFSILFKSSNVNNNSK